MPVLYAHRGASADLPENTIPAFLRALEVGATAIETDVHRSRDGHIVISHDPTGAGSASVHKALCDTTLAELRTWDVGRGPAVQRRCAAAHERFTMPTLEEALLALPEVPFNVDIKQHDEATARAVVATVRDAKATSRVLLTSFDAKTVLRVRKLGYEGATGLGQREILRLLGLPTALLRRLRAPVMARHQGGESPPRADALQPVTNWNCGDAMQRRRGEHQEVKTRSATKVNSIRSAGLVSFRSQGEAQTCLRLEREARAPRGSEGDRRGRRRMVGGRTSRR